MLEELALARKTLHTALENYRDACSAVESYCNENSPTESESSRIFDETRILTNLIEILDQSKISIHSARNSSRYTVPINRLPPEILLRILRLATLSGHETCEQHTVPYCPNLIHHQPPTFAAVCVRWRKFMLQCPTFWTRIDLVHGNNQKHITRAKSWADRASTCPLDIRIAAAKASFSNMVSTEFLHSTASRSLRSLSFVVDRVHDEDAARFFGHYFLGWEPGTLEKLVVKTTYPPHSSRNLIKSATGEPQTQDPRTHILIDLPAEYLEALWRPIKIMRLHGVYLDWGSQAYHGLVELCLVPIYDSPLYPHVISDWQLKAILTSSPALRIFRFGLDVVSATNLTHSARCVAKPVQLDDLEVLDLDLDPRSKSSLAYVLRCVSPGSKPLKLLLPRWCETVDGVDLISRHRSEISDFCMRSKVVELYLCARTLSPDWLLASAPNLQTLCVRFDQHGRDLAPMDQGELGLSIPPGNIDRLFILSSALRMHSLCRWLSRFPPIQTLAFRKCSFDFSRKPVVAEMLLTHPQLLNICSEVVCVSADSRHTLATEWISPRGYFY